MSVKMLTEILSEDEIRQAPLEAFNNFGRRLQIHADRGGVVGILNSLTVPKHLSESELLEWNERLAASYRSHSLPVLGGDTSTGAQFLVIATVLLHG
jgi:hypothetical protein